MHDMHSFGVLVPRTLCGFASALLLITAACHGDELGPDPDLGAADTLGGLKIVFVHQPGAASLSQADAICRQHDGRLPTVDEVVIITEDIDSTLLTEPVWAFRDPARLRRRIEEAALPSVIEAQKAHPPGTSNAADFIQLRRNALEAQLAALEQGSLKAIGKLQQPVALQGHGVSRHFIGEGRNPVVVCVKSKRKPNLDPGVGVPEQADDMAPTLGMTPTGEPFRPAVCNLFGFCISERQATGERFAVDTEKDPPEMFRVASEVHIEWETVWTLESIAQPGTQRMFRIYPVFGEIGSSENMLFPASVALSATDCRFSDSFPCLELPRDMDVSLTAWQSTRSLTCRFDGEEKAAPTLCLPLQ